MDKGRRADGIQGSERERKGGIEFGKPRIIARFGHVRQAALFGLMLLSAAMLEGCFSHSALQQPIRTVMSDVTGGSRQADIPMLKPETLSQAVERGNAGGDRNPEGGAAAGSAAGSPGSDASGKLPANPAAAPSPSAIPSESAAPGEADAFRDSAPEALAVRSSEAAMQAAPWIATAHTTRINAADPYEAAVLASRMAWPSTEGEERLGGVVIVPRGDWIAAVLGAGLIDDAADGPLLYADADGIPEATLQELKRLRPIGAAENGGVQAILVGALGPQVQRQAEKLGLRVERIAARGAADLARAVDAYEAAQLGEYPADVLVGSGDEEARLYTAPAVSLIASGAEPLLLVSRAGVPLETAQALELRGGKARIHLIAPESIVPSEVAEALAEYGQVTRISGEDHFAQSVAMARYGEIARTGAEGSEAGISRSVSLVSSESPSLAPVAALLSRAGMSAPLLWTEKEAMPETVLAYVKSRLTEGQDSLASFRHAWLIGELGSLSMQAQGEVDAVVQRAAVPGLGKGEAAGSSGGGQRE
ncbi:cell wall-binding repeat-containing protein [Paenibacillus sp. D51F]